MKIINTFVTCLYAIKYSENSLDELERLFDEWADPMYLHDFFEENIKDIDMPLEEAINKVKKEAIYLRNKLIELAEKKPNQLNLLFKNLDNSEYTSKLLQRKKASKNWLRLYAIKVEGNNYVITGGAIKLDSQKLMKDKNHTLIELNKINKCRDFLLDEGVIDDDSFQEIFF